MHNNHQLTSQSVSSSAQVSRTWSRWRKPLLLGTFIMVTLAVYCFNLRYTATADTIPNSVVPFAILNHHNIFIGQYLSGLDLAHSYFVRPFHGGYISIYPIGAALTALPFYSLFLLMGGHAGLSAGLAVSKVASAVITVISALIFYRTLKILGISRGNRLLFLCLYAFGTETFAISSQGLWQHGPAELWISLFLMLVAQLYRGTTFSVWKSLVAGVAIGMLLLTRPQDMIAIIPFFILLASRSRRKYVLYAIPVVVVFACVYFLYNYHFYSTPTHYGQVASVEGRLSASLALGLAGNLISPSRGLFVFVPWALAASFWVLKVREKSFWMSVYAPSLLAFVLYVLMYSKLSYWAAGSCYGPRYMTDISPVVALLSAGFLQQWVSQSRVIVLLRRVLLGVFAAWSIAVQTLGVYVPGTLWNSAVLPDTFTTGIWSIRYGEIAYYTRTLFDSMRPEPSSFIPKAQFSSIRLFEKTSASAPPQILQSYLPDRRYSGIAIVKNTGSHTWLSTPAYDQQRTIFLRLIVLHQGHPVKMNTLSAGTLLHDVKPGQSIAIRFYFPTPAITGTYTYKFSIVQGTEHLESGMPSKGQQSKDVRVQVRNASN